MYSRAIVRSVQVLVSATSDRAMLVGQACQDVPRTRYSLSPLSLSVSCVFPSCLLSFTGQEREVFLGPRAPLTVLDPSATLMSLPGSRGEGVGGQAWICTLSSLSFTMDWGGRRAEREGGLSAGCALPGPIHHRFLRLWSPHFLLPKAWPSLVEAALGAGFCPDYVYFPLHPAFLLSSSLSPFLLSSPFFFLPPVSLFSLLSRVLVSRNVGKGPAVQPRDQAFLRGRAA